MKYSFSKKRNKDGVYQIQASNYNSYAYSLATIHCEDRFLQMEMVRLITKGQLSEKLKADDETLEIDKFMRKVGFHKNLNSEIADLKNDTKDFLNSYLDGINDFLAKGKIPFEFKIVKHLPEKWSLEDIMATMRIMSYIGLAQTQEEMEKFIIKLINLDYPIDQLKDFFSPLIDGISKETISQIKALKFSNFTMPNLSIYKPPIIKNSNNWILGKSKTKCGEIIMCSDPHLEVNRLPAVWYECIVKVKDDNFLGITMPGVPGFIMGKTNHVSYSFTYGFMDLVDFFIENISENKILRGQHYEKLDHVTETIKRKGKPDYIFSYYEKDGNLIESKEFINETGSLEDGFYLSKVWYGKKGIGASLNSIFKMHFCKNAYEAQAQLKNISISCNWLIGDQDNIIYQQSGQLPKRFGNGIIPLPGWIKGNINLEKNDTNKLISIVNPSQDYLCTANNYIFKDHLPVSINLPMGEYRYQRIKNIIDKNSDFTFDQLKEMQCDLFSNQADQMINLLIPLIPDCQFKLDLINWDRKYVSTSKEAYLFEVFYRNLVKDLFGEFLGINSWEEIIDKTPIAIDYYHFFDRLILDKNKRIKWFKSDELFNKKVNQSFLKTQMIFKTKDIKTYGEYNFTIMKHLFFAGKIPKIFGFDHGPIPIEGSRATIVQGVVYQTHGRDATFCPSWRFISKIKDKSAYSVLAGGISDRRFSRLYKSDISNWLSFKYKKIAFIE